MSYWKKKCKHCPIKIHAQQYWKADMGSSKRNLNIFLLFDMLEKEDQVTKNVGQVHYWTLDINHKLGFDTFSNFDPLKLLGQCGQTMKNSPLPTLKGLPVKTKRKHWLRKGLYFILNYLFLFRKQGGKWNSSTPGNITDSLAHSLP